MNYLNMNCLNFSINTKVYNVCEKFITYCKNLCIQDIYDIITYTTTNTTTDITTDIHKIHTYQYNKCICNCMNNDTLVNDTLVNDMCVYKKANIDVLIFILTCGFLICILCYCTRVKIFASNRNNSHSLEYLPLYNTHSNTYSNTHPNNNNQYSNVLITAIDGSQELHFAQPPQYETLIIHNADKLPSYEETSTSNV
jgi:hypothetical protein